MKCNHCTCDNCLKWRNNVNKLFEEQIKLNDQNLKALSEIVQRINTIIYELSIVEG